MAADLAEIIMESWRSCNSSGQQLQHEFMSAASGPPAEIDNSRHVNVFREMLLAGATRVSLASVYITIGSFQVREGYI